jgi:hypothetical protein
MEVPSECLQVVHVGTAGACQSSLTTYQMAGYCGGVSKIDAGQKSDGGGGMTLTQAITGNVTTPITVNAFVTALAGVPMDYPTWYIEDSAGGENSGIAAYCDPAKGCTVTEPALHDLIQISGSIAPPYMGQRQFIPTAMKVLQSNATPPPVPALTAAEIAPTASSPYRGVYVSLTISPSLVVDGVTPMALFDTGCGAVVSADAGAPPAACSSLCEPPAYSGFRANDGSGNEVYIEAPFFNTDPLQSSPECLTQSGVVAVKVGSTFSKMSGILDIDPYAQAQALSPVQASDYSMP